MPGIGNNLYPPSILAYMPAFVRTTACKIYFSLSVYNTVKEIKNVQIVISNQNTNLSALSPQLYPAGIKIAELQKDENRIGDDKYFVTIEPEDLQSGIFELNQYYKVQLRFTGIEANDLNNPNQIAKWLVDNQQFFSEWSTVCLIKGIQKPEIYLKNFEKTIDEREMIFATEIMDFVGQMYFTENGDIEKEYLKYYNIKIYKTANNELAYDSGDIYTNPYSPNEINYTLKTALEDGVTYQVVFSYTTINEYTDNVSYTFAIIQNVVDPLDATITATLEEELGRVKIDIIDNIGEVFFGNLTIRRTSSESDFTIWEDIHETPITEGKILNYTWYDYTIESGIWYKYCAQRRNTKGDRGKVINIRYPVMAIFDDMFLTRGDMQIRLRYNPQISSFKKTMLESKTETLGSKYPIIRRNGNVGYRQFPIAGLITSFCDEEGIFINRENTFGNSISYYDNYNNENDIDQYQDFIYERKFREKVMNFLHENTIKLFRSSTEGNILVKLMDISFTPNQTLGRMLYSFTATAYEIDDCSLANFNKYGIQSIGNYSTLLKYTFDTIGQIQGTYQGSDQDILKILQDKYTDKTTEKYIHSVRYMKWLRLEFDMPPYLIRCTPDGAVMPLPAGEKPNEDIALGYIVNINNKPILVSQRGYYELIDNDTEITSITFPVASKVTIDYMVRIDQTENTSLLFNKISFFTKVGQISDSFPFNDNIFLRIYQKYLLNYKEYRQEFLSLNRATIEAVPGTIVYIKDSFDDDYFKHEIGQTGVLEFFDEDATITGLYFGGIQLYETTCEDEEDEVRDTEFRIIEGNFDSLKNITNPIKHGVYTVEDKRYIYYDSQWYNFSEDNIVECPTYALIDYIYEYMKGEY